MWDGNQLPTRLIGKKNLMRAILIIITTYVAKWQKTPILQGLGGLMYATLSLYP